MHILYGLHTVPVLLKIMADDLKINALLDVAEPNFVLMVTSQMS